MSGLVEQMRSIAGSLRRGRWLASSEVDTFDAAADRITQLEADKAVLRQRLSDLAFRAYEYVGNYLLDERDEPELCAMFPNQHERIVALFDAIEDADKALSRIGGEA